MDRQRFTDGLVGSSGDIIGVMKRIEMFLKSSGIGLGIGVGMFVWLSGLALFLFNYSRLPFEMPWFYSLPWGEQRLIEKNSLLGLYSGVLGLFVIDIIIALFIEETEDLIKQFLTWGGVVTIIIFALGLWRMFMVVL